MTHLSEQIFDILKLTIEEKGSASFVVSGGTSPIKIFNELSFMDLEWTKVNITLVDDRFVDKSHNDSNEKLVNDLSIDVGGDDTDAMLKLLRMRSIEESNVFADSLNKGQSTILDDYDEKINIELKNVVEQYYKKLKQDGLSDKEIYDKSLESPFSDKAFQ